KEPTVYYVRDSAYDGFVGSRKDYYDYKALKSIHSVRTTPLIPLNSTNPDGFFPRPSPNAFGVDENPEGQSDPSSQWDSGCEAEPGTGKGGLKRGLFFVEVRYRKVPVISGQILALTPDQYKNLPYEEKLHWSKYWMSDSELRQVRL
ncbi:MAG: hypothetical protein QME51_07365, partial [Planctomycetota bacterium]|nr:hypothetical protein [Planctomycetota bacterium]